MGKLNVALLKRKAITTVLSEAAVALWIVGLLVLHPGVAWGFGVLFVGKRSSGVSQQRQRMKTVPFMSTTIPTEIRIEEEKTSCHDVDDSSSGDGDRSSLLCPSSYPSKTFAAPNLEISYQPIDTDENDCTIQLLPLQKYHARTEKRRNPNRRERMGNNNTEHDSTTNIVSNYNDTNGKTDLLLGKPNAVRYDIPSLDFIYENQSRFQITKSSQVLLEEYHNHKQNCINLDKSDNTTLSNADDDRSNLIDPLKFLELLEGRLRSKIRAECRASLPLSIHDTLQILYCDSHICVVNKPSGVLSVPGHKRNPSLATLVYDTIQPSSCSTRDDGSIDGIDQTVVHRLDMATSGIIVYALSKEALQKLHVTFRDRKVQKTYQALVEGHLLCCGDGGGVIEGEIDVALERDPTNPPYMRIAKPRDEPTCDSDDGDTDNKSEWNKNSNAGNDTNANDNPKQSKPLQHKFWREAPKPSMTTWSILRYEHDRNGNPLTRVALKPHTGRTHQLRVHTSMVLGTPIVGDDIYGSGSHEPNVNLCLHAQQLCIHHPITGAPMVFEADPPF